MLTAIADTTKPFRDARHHALLARLLDFVRRKPSAMFAFELVRTGLYVRGQRALGLRSVPLTHIIGSEGRHRDFDRHFRPRTDIVEQRWLSVEHAITQGRSLPPVELYKISGIYFVRDGNHRVSVARHHGWLEIEAEVTELLVDVELTPELSMHTLLLQQERSDFLEWTNLHTLRPDQRIESAEPGGYLDLVREINRHRFALEQAQQRPIERDEAVADWYDSVYTPRVQLMREQHMIQHCRGCPETDVYRRLHVP